MFPQIDQYTSGIRNNFQVYDKFLLKFKNDRKAYDALFSIRTYYAVHSELGNFLGTKNTLTLIKTVLGIIWNLLLLFFQETQLSSNEKAILLHYSSKDKEIANDINAKLTIIEKQRNFSLKRIILIPMIFKLFYYLLKDNNLNRAYILKCLSHIISYTECHHNINLNNIKTIISENDVWPIYVAIITKAKEHNIRTIKIENALIDDIQHNNVLCEYYYYPSIFHKHIREKFEINKNLKYIKGGFLSFDKLNEYQQKKDKDSIVYFTCGVDFYGRYGDLFYINEILDILPQRFILNIKVHPRDNIKSYEQYMNNERCNIIYSIKVDNYKLISESSICISIFSSLSLEAKLINKHSYFINYWANETSNIIDYKLFNSFFDTIETKKELKKIILGKFKPIESKVFSANYNIRFPNTIQHFRSCLNQD